MPQVFLSYSTRDHHFAELVGLKLAEAKIDLWRDQSQLRAGSEWRAGIERGIANSMAVLVALSEASAESSYVTFEWAFALGMSKTIVPLKLEPCRVHPRLEPIQHLDFSIPGSQPWGPLFNRIHEIETGAASQEDLRAASAPQQAPKDPIVKAILAYMAPRGYHYVSYDRIRRRIEPTLTDDKLDELVLANGTVFTKAVLAEGKRGLRKVLV